VKFNAQKGHQRVTETFSKLVLYGNGIW